MEIIKNLKMKNLTINSSKSRKYIYIYIAIISAGKCYTISLQVRYNANVNLRSFCCTAGV